MSAISNSSPINIVVRGAAGQIGRQVVTFLSRMIPLSKDSGFAPQIKLWALVRSLKNIDGYSGAVAMSSNRSKQRNVDSILAYGIDEHSGPSQLFMQKDHVATIPIKYITDTNHIENPDLLIDCTGNIMFNQVQKVASSINAKRTIVSAPIKGIPKGLKVPFKVAHINTDTLEDEPIISAASCTTNGSASMIAPLIKNLPIEKPSDWLEGTLVTIHEPTNTQKVLDSTKNDAKGKQTMGTIFDTTTGAAIALKHVFPKFNNFFANLVDAKAIRHSGDGSQIDLEFTVRAKDGAVITADMIRNSFKQDLEYRKNLINEIEEHGKLSPAKTKEIVEQKKKEQSPTHWLTDRKDINSKHILNTEIVSVIKSDSIKVKKLDSKENLYKIMLSGLYDNVVGYSAQLADLSAMYLNKYHGTKIPMLDRENFWNIVKVQKKNSLNKAGIKTWSNYLAKNNLKNKTVGMRLELNVTWSEKDGKLIIKDATRIDKAWPDLKAAIKSGANVAIMYHVEDKKKVQGSAFKDNSLIHDYLAKKIKQEFGSSIKVDLVKELKFNCSEAKTKLQALKQGKINVLLLQNVRLDSKDRQMEKSNDPALVQDIAHNLDLYVDCGTGLMHRYHASNHGLKKLMKTAGKPVIAGDIFITDTAVLQQLINGFNEKPEKSLAIFAGAKIANTQNEEGKIGILHSFIDLGVKNIILGGKMVNAFLVAQEKSAGPIPVSPEEVKLAKNIIQKANANDVSLILPKDYVTVKKDDLNKVFAGQSVPTKIETKISADRVQLDVGPATQKTHSDLVQNSEFRMWNGPVGVFENPIFAKGTDNLARVFGSTKNGLCVLGGGDTIAATKKIVPKDTTNTKRIVGGGAPMKFICEGGRLETIELMKN